MESLEISLHPDGISTVANGESKRQLFASVDAVARAIRRARVGLKDPRRPIGTFIFLVLARLSLAKH